ncbi:MAG: sigma-54 dependent transcriptional regulator [Caldimicrobium sp.]|nr:sigma-54 dependent transcriptional regulator [Caldimicrobium sp.]MCX7873750.1 sigma-54 dependent transcriptional regulator [Caldimicrobium sp.]MDW8093674.1 sigma-54 dependent transcriptional regulator [Caldimicrobium sp.]
MKGKVGVVGESLEAKVLVDSLRERGLEVIHWDKSSFSLESIPEDLSVLAYECSEEEIEEDPKLEALLRKRHPSIIVLTEDISLDSAIALLRKGAMDVKLLSSSIELIEKSVLYALENRMITSQEETFYTCEPKLLKILGALEEVAKTKVSVLLIGESGTGKELLARYIHFKSPRREGPFIAINCAALPENLLESELFGYEKGAFSGAAFRKKGKIELAHQGTLFLDEITEMALPLQGKILRVIQEGEVDRLGGYYPIKVDFRLISATNRDIEKEVEAGRFRSDLYYRLNVITVKIPPLRERREDVKFLAKYYLEKFSRLYNKKLTGFTERAWQFLLNYSFPGNVRELKNIIERAVILCGEEKIDVSYLTQPLGEESSSPVRESPSFVNISGMNFDNNKEEIVEIKPLEEVEREVILKALQLTKGNKNRAAELLGITVRTLRNKLKMYEEQGLL